MMVTGALGDPFDFPEMGTGGEGGVPGVGGNVVPDSCNRSSMIVLKSSNDPRPTFLTPFIKNVGAPVTPNALPSVFSCITFSRYFLDCKLALKVSISRPTCWARLWSFAIDRSSFTSGEALTCIRRA